MRFSKTLKALLLAGAILAPAITLAVLGIRANRAESLLLRERYKQDQAAIVQLVAGRMQEAARKALTDLEGRYKAHEPDAGLESRVRSAHPLVRHILLIRAGQLIYPAIGGLKSDRSLNTRINPLGYLVSELDVRNYISRVRESRRLATLLGKGLRAEFRGKLPRAEKLFNRAARGRSDPAAQALLGLARVARQQGKQEAATTIYRNLRRRFGGRLDQKGISYALLADSGQAELGSASRLLRLHHRLLRGEYTTSGASRRFYLRWAIERLARFVPPLSTSRLSELRRMTRHLFSSERFGALLNRHGVSELEQLASGSIGGGALDNQTVLVLRQQGDIIAGFSIDEPRLRNMVASLQEEVMPSGRKIMLQLRRIGEPPPSSELVLHSSVISAPLSYWTLTSMLSARDPLDLANHRSGLKSLGTYLGLILVLLVGLLLTFRGVRRESELARLKSDFASNVSHELKTPLTSIRMYAEMLQENIATTSMDRTRYQGVIVRESERLGRLIANVLDYSQVERGTRRYDIQEESLADMTMEAVETFSRLSEGEEIAIKFDARDASTTVSAEREAAVQSILNLLSNAAKYSLRDPKIEVSLKVRDGEAGVQIEDRGMGIPAVELKRIFDDFYRAPGSREAGVEGTGLGLALVRRHMKACRGRVEATSVPGEGSKFTLWFSKADEQESRDVEDTDH